MPRFNFFNSCTSIQNISLLWDKMYNIKFNSHGIEDYVYVYIDCELFRLNKDGGYLFVPNYLNSERAEKLKL